MGGWVKGKFSKKVTLRKILATTPVLHSKAVLKHFKLISSSINTLINIILTIICVC